MIEISCVMSVYNETEQLVMRAISSMLNQTYPIMEYVIIIDNPEAKDLIDKIGRFSKTHNEVEWKIEVNQQNKGLPFSLNRGISIATCDYIARMDADDEALPNRIKDSVELMDRLHIDFVTTPVEVVDENGILSDKQRVYPHSISGIRRMGRYVSCVVHPTWLLKKEIWNEIGGYREQLITAQDFDFQSRCLKKGYDIATTNTVGLRYTVRSDSISGSKKYLQSFLAAYIQDYVWNNRPFDIEIIKKTNSEDYKEYSRFKKAFDSFFNSNSLPLKGVYLIIGLAYSAYFRKFVRNVVVGKKLCKYYIQKEKKDRRGERW